MISEGDIATPENQHQLKSATFALLLNRLYQKRATGLLQLDRDSVKKAVYFKRGYPIFSRSNLVRESLGQMLIREGKINQEQCDAGLAHSREKKCYLGTSLIDLGQITPHQLHEVLKRQVVEKLLEIFSWNRGNYSFITVRDFRAGVTSIDMSPASLLHEGISRYGSTEQVDILLSKHRMAYLMLSENPELRFQDLNLSEKEKGILGLCNGCMTLDQIVALNPLSRKPVRALLAALVCAGILEPRNSPISDSCPLTEMPESHDSRLAREAFLKDYDRLMGENYFELFDLKPGAAKEEVRQSYFRMAKIYHPDRFLQKHYSDQFLDQVTKLFQHITRAYEILMDPDERKRYIAVMNQSKGTQRTDVHALVQAELAFRKGEFLIRKREFAQAVLHLRQAVSCEGSEAEYLCLYAWALYKANPSNHTCAFEAHEKLLKAKDMNPGLAQTHLYLGFMYKDEKRSSQAQREFELAIQCDPDCTEALRELRLLGMRGEEEKKKGFWDRILRKK